MTDDERAADYRAEQARRIATRRLRCKSFVGDSAAAAAVNAAWKPVTDYLKEQRRNEREEPEPECKAVVN